MKNFNFKLKGKENEIKLILIFLIVLLIMIYYFSYEAKINDFLPSQKLITYAIIFALSIISCITSIYLVEKEKIKTENAFLIVVAIFGLLMCLTMPITKGHDEPVHGYRIYEYVSGKFVNNGKSVDLNEGIIEALEDKPTYANIFFNEKTYDANTPIVTYEYRMSSYSPISYLPHISGILVTKIFTSNSMVQLYMARLFNLATCICMIYFAIKIIPFGKNMLFLIALIPIAIEGYITLSVDGIAIASSMLFISYILKLKYEKNLTVGYKQILILTLLAILVAIAKTVYLPIVLLILIIPKEKFNKINKPLAFLGIFAIAFAIDFSWYKCGIKSDATIAQNTAWNFIFNNPTQYMQKLLYTIVSRFGIYLNELFGGKIEYNENVPIYIFPYILIIATAFVIRNNQKEIKFSKWDKFVILGIIASIVILIFTVMFTDWSKFNINYIRRCTRKVFITYFTINTTSIFKRF